MGENDQERFTLRPIRGWFVIERHVADHDFDPPLWCLTGEVARFETREDARLFMVARTSEDA